MISASISQLKANPAGVISQAYDYPVAVENRSKVQAYLIGKQLYEKLIDLVEDKLDRAAVADTDFNKGKNFEALAKDLGI